MAAFPPFATGEFTLNDDPRVTGFNARIGSRATFGQLTFLKYGPNATNWARMRNQADDVFYPFVWCIRKVFAAGVPGTPDDVIIFDHTDGAGGNDAPMDLRVVDSKVLISTAIAATTVQLRSAPGGGGSAASDAWSSAATGTKRDTGLTVTLPIAWTTDDLVLRRSNRGVAGEVIVFIAPAG